MTDEVIASAVLWGFVFIYSVMATMDFGAGFWSMVYMNRSKTAATNIANRYLSPTWEVTNTFVVALVVAIYSMFPGAAYTLGTVLLIPGSMILLLLTFRSAFLVFSHVADDYRRMLTYISGITGMLLPALLISVLPISHGGFVQFGEKQTLDLGRLFTSPNEYAFIGFAISSTLFLSSLLLSDYSRVSDELEAFKIYRKNAMIAGPITLLMAFLIMLTLRQEANWIYKKMLEDLPLLIMSVVFFLIAGFALFFPVIMKKKIGGLPRLALIAITIQYLIAGFVYGRAHLPYIVYPYVTIKSGFTDPNSFRAIFATYIIGFAILFPGFVYFWRMFMHDSRYLQKKKSGS